VTKKDDFLVKATVGDTWQLRWWVLSQGDAVRVLRPARLRREIVQQLRAATARYE